MSSRDSERLRELLSEEVGAFDGTAGIAIESIPAGVRTGINEERVFPMASVFKIPILVEFLAMVEGGSASLDDRIELRAEHRTAGSGILARMDPGLNPTWKDLLTLMINISDNSATDLVLDRVGISAIQRRLDALGLEDTKFNANCTDVIRIACGLPPMAPSELSDELESGVPHIDGDRLLEGQIDTSTPADMVRLLVELEAGRILGESATGLALDIMAIRKMSKRLAGGLPRRVRVASKTGTIGSVVNDAGIIGGIDDDCCFAICAFTKYGGDESVSERFIARIAALVYDYLREDRRG